jgi:hypothetical protein
MQLTKDKTIAERDVVIAELSLVMWWWSRARKRSRTTVGHIHD